MPYSLLRRQNPAARLCALAACLVLSCSGNALAPDAIPPEGIRVLSWNVSGNPLAREPRAFAAMLQKAEPDIMILDEVSPKLDLDHLQSVLTDLDGSSSWQITMGRSGGRQRIVIATRRPHRPVPGLSLEVPYPPAYRTDLEERMSPLDHDNPEWRFEMGIPVGGVVVETVQHRLLLVGLDLQCCGNRLDSWQERRRRLEAKEIRRRIHQTLGRMSIDGIVIAGDLNLVGTVMPLVILTGPYGNPARSLSPAELYQLDDTSAWTWDGQGTKYQSRPMDFQLYESRTLEVRGGYVLDSRDLAEQDLEALDLRPDDAHRVSDHRPLLVEYAWLEP